jgi:DNA-binding NarL/FixJ family response regulator
MAMLDLLAMKHTLSRREEQVLKLLLAEYSQGEIASTLELSLSRVYSIKSIILEKWEIEPKNLMSLLLEAIRRGYVEVDRDNFSEFTNSEGITLDVN